jgi:hypothetical protein
MTKRDVITASSILVAGLIAVHFEMAGGPRAKAARPGPIRERNGR